MAADSNTFEPRVIAYDQRLAKIVVAAIKGLPISPNVLTALGMLVGIASGFLYAQGTRDGMIAGSLLFMVAVWMDHVDGEFARATGKTSKFGHYFHHVAAMTSYCAMFIGAGYGLRDTWLGDWSVICGISAGASRRARGADRCRRLVPGKRFPEVRLSSMLRDAVIAALQDEATGCSNLNSDKPSPSS